MLSTMSSSHALINLEDYISSFLWKKRIVLLITKEKHINIINETDDFFSERNSCENGSRNLKYIKIIGDDIDKYVVPDRYKNKYGIWLIGYDGGHKSYSANASLVKEIYNIIDRMPIRQSELVDQSKRCG